MKVVVTGGGTLAPIDDVRYIANISSGHFSSTIAEACLSLGAEVKHIHAPRAQLPYRRLASFNLDTLAPDLEIERLMALRDEWIAHRNRLTLVPLTHGTVNNYAETLRQVLETEAPDIIFLAMAVSDFEPIPVDGKIDSNQDEVVIHARRTPKVIRMVREWSPASYLVGFKLLSNVPDAELIAVASAACRANRADLTVANDLATVRAGRHTVHLVRPNLPTETLGPGTDLTDRLVKRVFALRGG